MSAQYRSIHILFLKGAERQYLHVNDALLDAVNNEKNLKVVFNYKIALYMYKKTFFTIVALKRSLEMLVKTTFEYIKKRNYTWCYIQTSKICYKAMYRLNVLLNSTGFKNWRKVIWNDSILHDRKLFDIWHHFTNRFQNHF